MSPASLSCAYFIFIFLAPLSVFLGSFCLNRKFYFDGSEVRVLGGFGLTWLTVGLFLFVFSLAPFWIYASRFIFSAAVGTATISVIGFWEFGEKFAEDANRSDWPVATGGRIV